MASSPPSGRPVLEVSAAQVSGLDLAPLRPLAELEPGALLALSGQLELRFGWPRDPEDPRELSEVPELRLWSLRADALHPWLPLLLERGSGTLTRHVAMLLPHCFQRNEGLRFTADSLELWITHRLFMLDAWCRGSGHECRRGLEQMAAALGFELDPRFWTPLAGGGDGRDEG